MLGSARFVDLLICAVVPDMDDSNFSGGDLSISALVYLLGSIIY